MIQIGDRYKRKFDNLQATVIWLSMGDTYKITLKIEGSTDTILISKETLDEYWEYILKEPVRAVPRILENSTFIVKETELRFPVLQEREKTHGDFKKVASVAQELKAILKHQNGKFTFVEQESLDLICTKLARIVCGNPHEPEHWKDIIGYATLVLESY